VGFDRMTKDIRKLCIFFSLFQTLWLPYTVATLVVASRNFIITVLNASISSKAVEMAENGTFYWNVLAQMGMWIVLFAFYDSMGIFTQTTIIHRIGVTLRKKMFSHALHAKVEQLDLFGSRQELLSRMNCDIDGAMGLLSYGVLSPIMCCISGIGASVIVFRVDRKLCIAIYCLGAVVFWSQCKLAKAIRDHANLVQKRKTNLFSFCMQIFNHSSLIRVSNLCNPLRDKLQPQTGQYCRESMDKGKLEGAYGFIQGVLRFACFVGIFCYCYFASKMRLADIVYLIQIAPLIGTMILSIADLYACFQKSMVNVDRVLELFEIPLENEEGMHFEIRQANLLAAENVVCKYEDCSVKILDFSVDQDCGNRIAFTGPSGCGKTTLLRMLLKLYDYSEGSLLLFGQEIKECDNSSLRSKIAYVPQENMIFPGSVRQNILFGNRNDNISDAQIYDIFSRIGANDFLDFVGLDTSLTENGTNLSGGQRQIIAIARAILYDKPIMILDEAFASIDIKYTSSVMNYLAQSGKYIMIVSHSDNILKKCSKVIVMKSTVHKQECLESKEWCDTSGSPF
jgi:ATP-binding cassette subfamily B multidrug efflux pump